MKYKLPYRLIAVDLDGTLFVEEDAIDSRVIHTLRDFACNGTYVTIATGRMFQSASKFADLIGANAPVICYNGAMIRDHRDGAVHRHRPVQPAAALAVLSFAREAKVHLNAYINDQAVIESLNRHPRIATWLASVPHRKVDDLAEELATGATKLSLVVKAEQALDLLREAKESLAGYDLAFSRSLPTYIEITDRQATKGTALVELARLCEVDVSETMVFGDSQNDLPMFAVAGLAVAMANAPDEIRQAADEIAGHVNDGGVATFLEHWLKR